MADLEETIRAVETIVTDKDGKARFSPALVTAVAGLVSTIMGIQFVILSATRENTKQMTENTVRIEYLQQIGISHVMYANHQHLA